MLVNAGGRVFETTALTLKTCGAGYFEALLGDTGAKLPGRKRARVSADGDDAPGGGQREIFIDRDPDRFADVLSFMRTSCLPSAVRPKRTLEGHSAENDLQRAALFDG